MQKKNYLSIGKQFGLFLFGFTIIASSCQELGEDQTIAEMENVSLIKEQGFIPGKFIVVLQEDNLQLNFRKTDSYEDVQAGMRIVSNDLAARYNVSEQKIDRVYGNLLTGFSVELTSRQLEAMEQDPAVSYIEQDGYAYASTTITQSNATWGLDRIDQRALPLNANYEYKTTGSGVTAYIIDTGIKRDHVDFGVRAQASGFDAFGGNGEDCNGHGSHVAGTVGGTIYGVAKGVSLVAVRVLDCNGSGSWSGVVAGMDWVASNGSNKLSVANMSLGGGASQTIDDAVGRMYDAGIPVIVAAGNGDSRGREQPACNYSPARAPKAYTVGATTTTDGKTSWSNYGSCVDIFAPGAGITSAWYTSNTALSTISGTSMASPHVAGVAALYLEANTTAGVQAVYDFISATATQGIVTNSSTAKNHLLYSLGEGNNNGGPIVDPVDPEPASIVLSGSGAKIKGLFTANLKWNGASSANVDIYRGSVKVATISSATGQYTDNTGLKGGGSVTYKVCEAGTGTCSNALTLNY
ncbi:S8 family peptidase [Rhodonellum sp.]|uniref:S8 family peptidase n=1 Tax=Rhodonellum sp. TaxID=2231180 RepID=UPI00271EEC3C|nr:S8 family peptidase [Rhodonellum sp.]MDO9553898.1 S8 family peptidase [Rhodonellum sp.]